VEGQIKEIDGKQEKKKAEVIMRAIYHVLKLITRAAYTSPGHSATAIPEEFQYSCTCYDTSSLCRCVK
jgi:hypothetical protein